jgi:prolyl-tRNA synthetase
MDGVVDHIEQLLKDIQQNLFDRAVQFREEHTTSVDNFDDFKSVIEQDIPGFISAHWDGTAETEQKIKELTKATIRCIPNDAPDEAGQCVLTGKPSNQRVLFAKAY